MGLDQHQKLAIVTGASRGIGAEYAKALARQGYSLLLVGRDETRLQQISEEISQMWNVEVTAEYLDLSKTQSAHQLFLSAQNRQKQVEILVNNAGFGMYGEFVNMPLPQIQAMLQLHINTVVESTRLFLPAMIRRGSGAIINVASLAGFFPIPYSAEYAATKAFLISFSEALAEEVRPSGVTIQACSPGYTVTDFHETARHYPRNPLPPLTPQAVANASLQGLDKGQAHVTVGWQGWFSSIVTRCLPRHFLIRKAANKVKPPTPEFR